MRLAFLGILTGALILIAGAPGGAISASAGGLSVQITSPRNGQTVKGTVTVGATATGTSDDPVERIYFYDGVNEINDVGCQGQPTCSGSVQWNATPVSLASTH